nr:autotransporter outer membrane beta-barrel domain-containing protein [Helicobacter anatolicus]
MSEGSKFLTDSKHLKIDTLTLNTTSGVKTEEILLNTFAQSNTIIDIATINPNGSLATNNNGSLNPATRTDFRLLEIGKQDGKDSSGLQGNGALFRVYVNADADQKDATLGNDKASNDHAVGTNNESGKYGYAYSDRILVLSGKTNDNSKTNYIQTLLDTSTDFASITYHGGGTEKEGNIAVATVKGTNGGQVAKFEGATQLQGFNVIKTSLVAINTDQYGKVSNSNGYTTYFLQSAEDDGISLPTQLATASALGANYGLYLANLNSLNKRMGELRDNANSQGAWARVFNGMQTSNFALETKSIYTTIQAGYDYAFGFNGANNYLGFALSYANAISHTKSIRDVTQANQMTRGIKNINSNAVEFAIYNAYIQDGASKANGFKNGLYTDSILKFSYIHSKLDLYDVDNTTNTSNFAITFSQELGYRFLLGNNNEWFIDPQAEIALGYLNQSEFQQSIANTSLENIQDSIFTLRGRLGSNFGYNFKNFTQNKGFDSELYLGTYFVGDYIAGGDVSLRYQNGAATLSPLNSTSRFVLNIGTNFTIKDKHRIYFDFERSFFGSIVTDYQINLGYRFSFGESKYTPLATNLSSEIKRLKELKKTKK